MKDSGPDSQDGPDPVKSDFSLAVADDESHVEQGHRHRSGMGGTLCPFPFTLSRMVDWLFAEDAGAFRATEGLLKVFGQLRRKNKQTTIILGESQVRICTYLKRPQSAETFSFSQ